MTLYCPWATLSFVEELVLDFWMEVDELPTEADTALDADELSACAETAVKENATAAP